VRGDRSLVVISAEDAKQTNGLRDLVESAIDRVAEVRPAGWSKTVVVVAVRDQRLMDTYFTGRDNSPEDFVAAAVPFYTTVPEWDRGNARFVSDRVVFNAEHLDLRDPDLRYTVIHELTHVAMASVTYQRTPLWLVEGFAEYVAQRGRPIVEGDFFAAVKRGKPALAALPKNDTFYEHQGGALNYGLAWLACRYIADTYGEARLVELYESFRRHPLENDALRDVLGVTTDELVAGWAGYVRAALQAG